MNGYIIVFNCYIPLHFQLNEQHEPKKIGISVTETDGRSD